MSNFDMFQPASRMTDPVTSAMAEHEYTLGRRATRCIQVLGIIVDLPGLTTGEMAREMFNRHPELPIASAVETPHKRVADLEEKGLIYRGITRKCTDTGRDRITWRPTELGIKEMRGR